METTRIKQTCECGESHFEVVNQKKQQRNLIQCCECKTVTNLLIIKK